MEIPSNQTTQCSSIPNVMHHHPSKQEFWGYYKLALTGDGEPLKEWLLVSVAAVISIFYTRFALCWHILLIVEGSKINMGDNENEFAL